MGPLRFEPYLRAMVWGGRQLESVLAKPLPDDKSYGEAWELSDHSLHNSVVANGPLAGKSLRYLMQEHRESILGPQAKKFPTFPWLVKFLDAHDWLSVQVHPDEKTVRQLLENEASKTEAWFILDVLPGSKIYAGLREGVTEDNLRQALQENRVADCLHGFEPQPGDCVFLPAGTVHAIGGGILLAEVQQTSDATFRLYDWDRRDQEGKSRPLHIEQAVASIHWEKGPVAPKPVHAFATDDEDCDANLVRCSYFHLDYRQHFQPWNLRKNNQVYAAIILRGSGRLACSEGEENLKTGQVWLLPADLGEVNFIPDDMLGYLLCHLP